MRFQKLRPYEGWGSLNFEFFVDNMDMNDKDCKYDQNWPELRQIRSEMEQSILEAVQPIQYEPEIETNYDDGGAIPDLTTGGATDGLGAVTC